MARKLPPPNLDFIHQAGSAHSSGLFAAGTTKGILAQPIPLTKLENNPYQPRTSLPEAGLQELAQVIRSQGFQGVLVARPHPMEADRYQITAGHRRRDAAHRAGLASLPVIVQDLSDEEMVSLTIVENIQREDLTPLEEGKIFLLMSEQMGYTHEQIAREIGKNRGYVENRLRVARAPEDIQALVEAKPDSLRAVSTLIQVKDPAKRAETIKRLRNNQLTADDLPGYLAALDQRKMGAPPTAIGDTSSPAQTRQKQRTGGEGTLSDEEILVRLGQSKLNSALRILSKWQAGLADRAGMSPAERATLEQIASMIAEASAYPVGDPTF